MASQLVAGGNIDWGTVAVSGATGALFGFISGPGAQNGKIQRMNQLQCKYKSFKSKHPNGGYTKNVGAQLTKSKKKLLLESKKEIYSSIFGDAVSEIVSSIMGVIL